MSCDLVGERGPHVDIEHHGAALDLLGDVDLYAGEVAASQLVLEDLAPRRVDALADDAKRLVVADDDLSCGRGQDGVHVGFLPGCYAEATAPLRARRAFARLTAADASEA